MNRVVLCGRLTGRPKSSYTPTGVAVAHFSLLISQEGIQEAAIVIPCYALRQLAQEMTAWGERGHRVNLEGRLRCLTDTTVTSGVAPMCVLVDAAYFVDPVMDPALAPDSPEPGEAEPGLSVACGGKAA